MAVDPSAQGVLDLFEALEIPAFERMTPEECRNVFEELRDPDAVVAEVPKSRKGRLLVFRFGSTPRKGPGRDLCFSGCMAAVGLSAAPKGPIQLFENCAAGVDVWW